MEEGAQEEAKDEAEVDDEASLYQISSGKFMVVMYLIAWFLMIFVVCGCCISCIASCLGKGGDD